MTQRNDFGFDTLHVPAYLATGPDDPGLDEWKREHPGWFEAGTWTRPPNETAGRRRRRRGRDATRPLDRDHSPLDPATISVADFGHVAAQARADARAQDATPPRPAPAPLPMASDTTLDEHAATVRPTLLPALPRVTADQLRAIMPNAGAQADRYVGAINDAMETHGIDTIDQRAAFLMQIAVESEDLHGAEKPNSTIAGAAERFRHAFPPMRSSQPASATPSSSRAEPTRGWTANVAAASDTEGAE